MPIKKLNKAINNPPIGPDNLHGGDGLPVWMQFTITLLMFGAFGGIILLLFDKDSYELDEKFRDLLNIIVGTFLASFGKVVDFWFKHDKSKKTESQ